MQHPVSGRSRKRVRASLKQAWVLVGLIATQACGDSTTNKGCVVGGSHAGGTKGVCETTGLAGETGAEAGSGEPPSGAAGAGEIGSGGDSSVPGGQTNTGGAGPAKPGRTDGGAAESLGGGASGADAAGAGQSERCTAWVRRLDDACPEHDTFLGYTACRMQGDALEAGDGLRWELEAQARRPPAAISPPDPKPEPADCSGLPPLQGNSGLPKVAKTACQIDSSKCTNVYGGDPGTSLLDSQKVGAWTLIGVGITDQGFMSVSIDGADQGRWTYVILSRIGAPPTPNNYPTPQLAIVYWNGFVRLKTWIADGTDYGFGTSVVLGPFLPTSQDPAQVANPNLHPRIESISFTSGTLASESPTAVATGGWYANAGQGNETKKMSVTWNLAWSASSEEFTRLHASVDAMALTALDLPFGIGTGSLSSMWASATTHDADHYEIGPLGGTPTADGNASEAPIGVDTAMTPIRIADWLALKTTTSTTHNSGSPDLWMRVAPQ